jgi:RNA polymerase sigma-70 factor (ECF subfamily)
MVVDQAQNSGTRATLIGRVGRDPNDPGAWAEFVRIYGPKIYTWCGARGLQDCDARDVTQNVLLNLAVRLRAFAYDPDRSFRAWLKTLTRHAWHDFRKAQKRYGQGTGDSLILDGLANVAAHEDLARRLEEAFDQELLREAVARVRLRVEPRTWEAFRLLAQENWSGAEAGRHLGMKVATVFVARSKVMRMLRDEVAKLDRD